MTRQRPDKCIRSLRIARNLMARGFHPINVEHSRKSKGFLTFVFDETPEFTEVLNEIMGGRI